MLNKKSFLFSTDALIALTMIFFVILVAVPISNFSYQQSQLPADLISVFSNLKVGEIDDPSVQALILSGAITDVNKSSLEQIGYFYASNDTEKATLLAQAVFSRLNTSENIGIWFGNELLASKNSSPMENGRNIEVERQVISGIAAGNTSAFSARAFLSRSTATSYFYFGGYVGDGNISINVTYDGQIKDAILEIAINKGFDLYINGLLSGHYEPNVTSDYRPESYNISSYLSRFQNGSNIVEFKGDRLYIAGGYLKILHEGSVTYSKSNDYHFPGINGTINLYDGFYFPPNLSSMSIYLHYMSGNATVFLAIGNTTILNETNSSEQRKIIPDSDLRTKLDYLSMGSKTIPLRFGLEEIAGGGQGGNADVILITDVSGSMDWNMAGGGGTPRNCSNPLIMDPSTQRLSVAKCLDINFTSIVLGGSGNRVALVSFSNSANSYTDLTNNRTLLNNTILGYTPQSGTCVACAINRAYEILKAQSSPFRKKFIVVMSDGATNRRAFSSCPSVEFSSVGAFDENTIFAGLENGFILEKEGSAWNFFQNPTANKINDIKFYNSTLGFAVANSGTILRWNSTSWATVSSPIVSNINGLEFLDSNFAIAVGDSGRVIKWDGTSWSSLATITNTPTLYSVSMLNSTLIFAAGEYNGNGKVYKSTNGGVNWNEDYSDGTILRGIKILNRTRGFAVGYIRSGSTRYIAQWNGTWNRVTSPTSNNLYSIDALTPARVYAVGGDNGARVINNSGAASWYSSYNSDSNIGSLRDVAVLSGASYSVGTETTVMEYNLTAWRRNFNIPLAYAGNSTTGVACTNDDDSCSLDVSFPSLNANYSSCRAHNELEATVYSIGFGPIATCSFANKTLKEIAQCGNGSFYSSTDPATLQSFYQSIAYDILSLSYSEQTANLTGSMSTVLFPDSYISLVSPAVTASYGILITSEKQFSDNSSGIFYMPENALLISAGVVSYSGPRWTSSVSINNSVFYNLSEYGPSYARLGDPYSISIPLSLVKQGYNTINLTTGLSPENLTYGSQYDKIIYTVVKNASAYSPLVSTANGCIWHVQFEDNTNDTLRIPGSYAGAQECYFTVGRHECNGIYECNSTNDAIQSAVSNLFGLLDYDSNHKLDIKFTQQDLLISASTITGIPYTVSTEVEVRRWY